MKTLRCNVKPNVKNINHSSHWHRDVAKKKQSLYHSITPTWATANNDTSNIYFHTRHSVRSIQSKWKAKNIIFLRVWLHLFKKLLKQHARPTLSCHTKKKKRMSFGSNQPWNLRTVQTFTSYKHTQRNIESTFAQRKRSLTHLRSTFKCKLYIVAVAALCRTYSCHYVCECVKWREKLN